ncbi:MAG: MinD/ParA family protein [Phycisphaerales bacterium]|jgi:flagellar biosynthesis protein FlhG|nr:MinD/ParA family protein [Phycisphaerales bacterium]
MHNDQAKKLREMMSRPNSRSRDVQPPAPVRTTKTIAVCSGKGGVGKSNIALNLSITLSGAGNRVALVDADMGMANLDVLLNVDIKGDLSHVVAGTKRLEDIVVDLPNGVQFVAGASGLARLANLSEFQRTRLTEELSQLEADNDLIVIDCGAGIGPDVLQFASGADIVLVVTTPEPTAITDAYGMIKALAKRGYVGSLSVLTNQVDNRQEGRATYQRLAEVARRFLDIRVFDAGYIDEDPRVRQAVRRRQAFVLAYPKCPASRAIGALVNKLSPGGALVRQKEGFFRRMARLFA